MKHFAFRLALAAVIVLIGTLASAQQLNSNSCLVVSGKKHDRIDSIGQMQFRSHYSDRQLRKLSDAGVHIVSLPKRRGDAIPDTKRVCGIEKHEHDAIADLAREMQAAREHSAVVPAAQAVAQAPRCLEWVTKAGGDTQCTQWSSQLSK
jgi:hypothetical protein